MSDMSTENLQGAPLCTALIVLVSVLLLTGIAISFQGSVQF